MKSKILTQFGNDGMKIKSRTKDKIVLDRFEYSKEDVKDYDFSVVGSGNGVYYPDSEDATGMTFITNAYKEQREAQRAQQQQQATANQEFYAAAKVVEANGKVIASAAPAPVAPPPPKAVITLDTKEYNHASGNPITVNRDLAMVNKATAEKVKHQLNNGVAVNIKTDKGLYKITSADKTSNGVFNIIELDDNSL